MARMALVMSKLEATYFNAREIFWFPFNKTKKRKMGQGKKTNVAAESKPVEISSSKSTLPPVTNCSPRVTRRASPPETPLIMSLPMTVSATRRRPSVAKIKLTRFLAIVRAAIGSAVSPIRSCCCWWWWCYARALVHRRKKCTLGSLPRQ